MSTFPLAPSRTVAATDRVARREARRRRRQLARSVRNFLTAR